MAAALAAIPSNYRAELEAAYDEDMDVEETPPIAAATIPTMRNNSTFAGGSSKPAAKPTAEHTTSKQYCYFHGYNNTHDGMACNLMEGDSAYTTTMRKARTHDAPALKALKLVGAIRSPRRHGSYKK